MNNEVFTVKIKSTEVGFKQVAFKSRFPGNPNYRVLYLGLQKVISCQLDAVSAPQDWSGDFLQKKLASLDPENFDFPVTPYVHAELVETRRKRWLRKTEVKVAPKISFTDGRHRIQLLDYLGAGIVPVCAQIHEVDLLLEYFSPDSEA